MKINRKPSSALTLIELLVVIAIIATLAALVVPALTSALAKAQMSRTMTNARLMYIAQFQMANDGAATGDSGLAWPGDLLAGNYLTNTSTIVDYVNILLANGYLKGADAIKLFNAPSANFGAQVALGPPEQINTPTGTASLKVYPVLDADPVIAIFCVSRNYSYANPLTDTVGTTPNVPYGTKGFIVTKKGGDCAIFRGGQATNTNPPWADAIQFQNGVGLKGGVGGDTLGNVSQNDPTPVFQFP